MKLSQVLPTPASQIEAFGATTGRSGNGTLKLHWRVPRIATRLRPAPDASGPRARQAARRWPPGGRSSPPLPQRAAARLAEQRVVHGCKRVHGGRQLRQQLGDGCTGGRAVEREPAGRCRPPLTLAGAACCLACPARRRTRALRWGTTSNSAGTEVTLAEQWNGTVWAIQTHPQPGRVRAAACYRACPVRRAGRVPPWGGTS